MLRKAMTVWKAKLLLYCDLCTFEDFTEILEELGNALLPYPDRLARELELFAIALGELQQYSTDGKRSIAGLAADADMAATWTHIHDRISDRARDFHYIEEYITVRREGNLNHWLPQWKTVRKARKGIVQERRNLEDILSGARRHHINLAHALLIKYGTMQALLDKEDELISQIDAVEARICSRIEENNTLVDETYDYPISEKDAKDFVDQFKADMDKLEAEMQVLADQRTVLTRRIEVARRGILGWPEVPHPQQDGATGMTQS